MKAKLLTSALFLISILSFCKLYADEGMWLPLFLKELNEDEMRAMGMKLSAEDIYNVNKASLKDAVVLFGRGCTGEIISEHGLLLTNHHCGYGRIQAHSSVEKDLLRNGFWAGSFQEELPNPGLTASILVYMEDVTDAVFAGVEPKMSEEEKSTLMNKNILSAIEKTSRMTHYEVKILPFYYGNQYIMMVYEVFQDVRLVAAPPSSIGKFGGDTDNWMWPRHSGDFSYFRIYADKNNNPAPYSPDNQPYIPKYSFTISLKGVQENDFTMVMGYPGTTNEYVTSHEIRQKVELLNPLAIELRRKRMDIMEKFMKLSDENFIKYSAKQFSIANGWKKMQGENKGIQKLNGIQKKIDFEKKFLAWSMQNQDAKEKYGNIIQSFDKIYAQSDTSEYAFTIFYEAGYSIEIVKFALQFKTLVSLLKQTPTDNTKIEEELIKMQKASEDFFKDYSPEVDMEISKTVLPYYFKSSPQFLPDIFSVINKKYKGNTSKFVEVLFQKSIFAHKELLLAQLNKNNLKILLKKIEHDDGYILATSIYNAFDLKIRPLIAISDKKLEYLYKIYMKGMMEMDHSRRFYPDANGTFRIAYGRIASYQPADGIKYNYYTTLEGTIEKSRSGTYDYVIEDKLMDFFLKKDYGEYADKDGTMRIAFIASNHTTGGNSGSPVLNAEGQLIGLNFDRAWESTMSDLMFDPSQCRNIAADIRYVLFITDKYAGAKRLIDEMKIVH